MQSQQPLCEGEIIIIIYSVNVLWYKEGKEGEEDLGEVSPSITTVPTKWKTPQHNT
jgi:hypothetical protein